MGKKVIRFLDAHFEEYILMGMMSIMVILIFVQVVMRYILGTSILWSEELARYLFIWITWLGAAFAVKENKLITVDVVKNKLPEPLKNYVEILAFVIFMVFNILLFKLSFELTAAIFQRQQLTPAMRIPMWLAYSAVPVGWFMMTVRLVQQGFLKIKRRKGGA